MRTIADILRMIGGMLASIVMFPFRLVSRLLNGASHGTRRSRPRRTSRPRQRRRASAGHRWPLSPRA